MAQGIFTLRQQNQALRQKAWSGTQKTNFVEYLVVAGGGGAGGGGAGGGAGGLLTSGSTGVSVGGSGIVIIRYPSYLAPATSTTGSPETYTTGGWRVYLFVASGTITF